MATSLSLVQSQKQMLNLSPAQIQVMRMLELPTCELLTHITEELQTNPTLEEGVDKTNETEDTEFTEEEYENPLKNGDFDYEDYTSDDDSYERTTASSNASNRPTEEIPFAMGMTFNEYLKSQIYLTKMDKPDRHIAKFVVGNIDDNGYLRRTTEELVDDLSFREGIIVTDSKMQEIIDQIKLFDPVGVAAHDAQECLLIQIRQKVSTPSIELAHSILSRHFDAFSKANFNKIKQRLLIDDQQLHDAIKEIKRLNPKPSSAWQGTREDINREIVIPDFIIENLDDVLVVSLNNSDIPSLRVSRDYINILDQCSQKGKSSSDKDATKEIKKYIDSARTFIDAIRQRNETMLRAMQTLVQLQREFFLQGDSMYLKPMVLKDIADITKYDVSTISRAFNNKYVQTEHGIIPLKFFFSEAMTNENGETISTRETKQRLQEIVNQEDKTHPLTDDELEQAMRKEGYIIARRTVAKYREQLNIPVARLRKEI